MTEREKERCYSSLATLAEKSPRDGVSITFWGSPFQSRTERGEDSFLYQLCVSIFVSLCFAFSSYSVSVPTPQPPCYRNGTCKTPVILPKVHKWQVTPKHAYIYDPTKSGWADYAAVQAKCRNPSRDDLTRNLSGNIRPQSSQSAETLWTDPGVKNGISVHDLISTSKKKKKRAQAENERANILPKYSQAGEKPTSGNICGQEAGSA